MAITGQLTQEEQLQLLADISLMTQFRPDPESPVCPHCHQSYPECTNDGATPGCVDVFSLVEESR